METLEKAIEMFEAYHHVVREFGGRITEADKEPSSVMDIVDEERWDAPLSAFAFGMSCCICGASVLSKDRSRLAKKGEVRTLCSDHLDKVSSLRQAIRDAHRKVDKTIASEIKQHLKPIRYEYLREVRHRLNPPPPPKPKAPRYKGPERKGYVYRLFDFQRNLLYVGKTWNVDARFYGTNGHASTKVWWRDVRFVGIEEYETEAIALEAEAYAINREQPRHNLTKPAFNSEMKCSPRSRVLRVLEDGNVTKIVR